MYIKNQRCWSTADGQQRASGSFLMLFSREPGGEIRAAVRHVKMKQLGAWMMGLVTLYGVKVSVSGAYGNDGLAGDPERKFEAFEGQGPEEARAVWLKLTPLPAELTYKIWTDDTGHNSPGRSGEDVRKWALEHIKALRRPYQGVNTNDERRLYTVPAVNLKGRVTGYTCLGYDYAERQTRRMQEWLRAAGACYRVPFEGEKFTAPGTVAHYTVYRTVCELVRRQVERSGRKCEIDLEPQLRGLEGRVVRVRMGDGSGATYSFRVGKSTGWIPAHLAIGPGQHGGSVVPPGPYEHVSVLGGHELLKWSMGEAHDAIN